MLRDEADLASFQDKLPPHILKNIINEWIIGKAKGIVWYVLPVQGPPFGLSLVQVPSTKLLAISFPNIPTLNALTEMV